jgi:hypothetical protein
VSSRKTGRRTGLKTRLRKTPEKSGTTVHHSAARARMKGNPHGVRADESAGAGRCRRTLAAHLSTQRCRAKMRVPQWRDFPAPLIGGSFILSLRLSLHPSLRLCVEKVLARIPSLPFRQKTRRKFPRRLSVCPRVHQWDSISSSPSKDPP